MGGAMKADVNLAFEALTEKTSRNRSQIVDAFPHADLSRAASDGRGPGVEIRQSRQHQPVGRLRHTEGECLADYRFAVKGQSSVELHCSHRNNDDIVACQIRFYLVIQHTGQNSRSHFLHP